MALGGDAFSIGVAQESQLPLGIADRLARVYGDTAIDRIKLTPTSSPHSILASM